MTRPGPHPHHTGFQQCPACGQAELVGRRGRLVCAADCGFDEPLATRTTWRPDPPGPPDTPTETDDDGPITVGLALAKARAACARARLTKSVPPAHQPNRTRR